MKGFEEDSKTTIDLLDLSPKLPSRDDSSKFKVKRLLNNNFKTPLCLGATEDKIVDREGVEETGDLWDCETVLVESSHDVMLGGRWENAAYVLLEWYRSLE